MLDDGMTLPVEIKVLDRNAQTSTLQITMTEGRKRQIRRVADTLGYPVQRLVRTHFATLSLGNLRPGEWRHLTETEVATLKAFAYSLTMTPRRFVPRPAKKSQSLRRNGRPSHSAESPERTKSEKQPARPPRRPAKPSSKPRPPRSLQRKKPSAAKRPPRR